MNTITQHQLRYDSDEIMRRVEAGEKFIVTRNGTPIAELTPLRPNRFVSAEALVAAFRGAPQIDFERFRRDVDAILNQDPTPRA